MKKLNKMVINYEGGKAHEILNSLEENKCESLTDEEDIIEE
jgi:hypothetical protein